MSESTVRGATRPATVTHTSTTAPARTATASSARAGASAALRRRNRLRLAALAVVTVAAMAAYLLVGVDFGNEFLTAYAWRIRTPKVAAMLLAAFAIGGASIVFQSVINNRIVTPCLLGMNSLYTLIHTCLVFVAGSASMVVSNTNLAFVIDLAVMGVSATLIYGYLFEKTRYNVLYVLLIGTVLTSLFGSIQSTLVRVMDPNEYDTLLNSLVASFSNMNVELIALSAALLLALVVVFRRDLALLNVLTLGRDMATNLGVDYNRHIRRLLLGVTLCIAVATALVGPISFLGLIVANLARQLLGTHRHAQLIAGSVLFGMITLLLGQLIVEQVFSYSVPISVFITMGGGAYFLVLLLTSPRV